jgi:hypothetical protein
MKGKERLNICISTNIKNFERLNNKEKLEKLKKRLIWLI